MLEVFECREAIEIQARMPAGQRVVILVFSLVPLLAPYELIVRIEWRDSFNVFFVFAAVIAAGAVAVSGLLAWTALAGSSSRLRFDWGRGSAG